MKAIGILLGVALLTTVAAFLFWNRADPPQVPEPLETASISGLEKMLAEAELDPARQKLIWDCEHMAFELEARFGKEFTRLLQARDKETLGDFFQEDFAGEFLAVAEGTQRDKAGLVERRGERGSVAVTAVDAQGMIDLLLEYLQAFHVIERRTLRVLSIDPLDREEGAWKADVLLGFAGESEARQRLEFESIQRIEFQIQDEKKLTNLEVISRWYTDTVIVRSVPAGLFAEATEAYGLAELKIEDNWDLPADHPANQYHFQTAVADYDRDGHLDIAVAMEGKPLLLHSVDGKRFEDVTRQALLSTWLSDSFMTSWIDFDNDGYPDLLMGDRLYRNVEGTHFVNVTSRSGIGFGRRPMGCLIADYNCDGWLDLYVLYQHPEVPPQMEHMPWVGDEETGAENQLWRNDGEGKFTNVTKLAGAGGNKKRSFAGCWFFLDDDHYPDLYVANDFGKNVVLQNLGDGTFADVTEQAQVGDYATSMGVAAGDLDNDGQSEIYVANMFSKMGRRIIGHVGESDYPAGVFADIQGSCAGNRLYRCDLGSTDFVEISEAAGVNPVGWAHAPAMADFDADGQLDLYATAGFLSFSRKKPDG